MSVKYVDYQDLKGAFAALRNEYTEEPPAQLEALLTAQIRRRGRVKRARKWSIAGAAAGIMLAFFVASRHGAPPAPLWVDGGGFVAVPYAEPLAPSEQVDVYRVELPPVTLAQYGFPARIDSPVTADVAVGSDGVVRAIRLMH